MPVSFSKQDLQQLVIAGDQHAVEMIQNYPEVAEDLIEDLLVASGQRLQTRSQAMAKNHPERFFLNPAIEAQTKVGN